MTQGEQAVRHLTREQFQAAARRYVDVHAGPSAAQLGVTGNVRDWEWHEGSNAPYTCHLRRISPVEVHQEVDREQKAAAAAAAAAAAEEEEEDEVAATAVVMEETMDDGIAIASTDGKRLATLEQSIVYSSTWHVPVLYIEAIGPDGDLLDVDGLVRYGIVEEVHNDTPPADSSSAAAEFPRLGLGENPATGRYGVYLHPCRTAATAGLLLNDDQDSLAYLEAFMMLCGTVVKMR